MYLAHIQQAISGSLYQGGDPGHVGRGREDLCVTEISNKRCCCCVSVVCVDQQCDKLFV